MCNYLMQRTETHVYVDAGRDGEIISNSVLSKYDWPDNDPRLKQQEVRPFCSQDTELIVEAARTHYFDLDSFLQFHQNDHISSQILEILNHKAFQFNSRKQFRQSSLIRSRIFAACEAHRPIEIIIPTFCVISNPLKRLQQTVVTVAEEITLRHLGHMASLIEQIYPPGIHFHVVSDSTFYAVPFGVTSVESHNYIRLLRKQVETLDLSKSINIHDMSELISEYTMTFQERFDHWWRQLTTNPLADGLSKDEYERWVASMMANINIRKMNLTYETMRDIFGPYAHNHGSAIRTSIQEQAHSGLALYRALKAAIADMKWEELSFPNAIRATIHHKSIPILGLRIYPEYKFRSKLLPYHGIAVIEYNAQTRSCSMSIKPEMLTLGEPNTTRVVNKDGVTLFYHKYVNS